MHLLRDLIVLISNNYYIFNFQKKIFFFNLFYLFHGILDNVNNNQNT